VTLATEPTTTALPLDRETVERLSVGRGEPQWLLEHRLAALERYQRAGFPTGHEEEWRRFPLKDLPAARLADLIGATHPPSEYGSIPLSASRHGLIFDRMETVAKEHPDLVKRSRVQMFGEDSAPAQTAAPTGDPLIDKYRHLYQQPGGGGQ